MNGLPMKAVDSLRTPPRWLVWTARSVLWAGVAVVLVAGVANLVRVTWRPAGQAAQAQPADTWDAGLGAWAAQAADAWLRHDTDTLAALGASGLSPPGDAVQPVALLPSHVHRAADGRAVVQVAVRLDDGTWLHLQVPVVEDGEVIALDGRPALVPAHVGGHAGDVQLTGVDVALSDEVEPTVVGFLEAFGGGEREALARWTDGVDLPPLTGLTLDRMVTLEAAPAGPQQAVVHAAVLWALDQPEPGDGGYGEVDDGEADEPVRLAADYRMDLTRNDNGRWYVTGLGPATASGTTGETEERS